MISIRGLNLSILGESLMIQLETGDIQMSSLVEFPREKEKPTSKKTFSTDVFLNVILQ